MFALTPHHQFWLYRKNCDMRKGFNGLSGLVRNELKRDPLSGEVFVSSIGLALPWNYSSSTRTAIYCITNDWPREVFSNYLTNQPTMRWQRLWIINDSNCYSVAWIYATFNSENATLNAPKPLVGHPPNRSKKNNHFRLLFLIFKG